MGGLPYGKATRNRRSGVVGVQRFRDTRFARRATRESDGLNDSGPGVALSESCNPGLISSTPSASSECRAVRGTRNLLALRANELPSATTRPDVLARNKEDLLDHAFGEDALFAPVGMQEKDGVAVRVKNAAVRGGVVGEDGIGEDLG